MKKKAFEIMDLALGLLALVLGVGFILQGFGIGFVSSVTAQLTSGALGVLVGIVFLLYSLRFFGVVR